jgi:hypothetical protein
MELNQNQINQLTAQGFTTGLIDVLTKSVSYFPHRVWVVDNSGSMNKNDGHRLVATKKNGQVKLIECTRWQELKETIEYHVQMAALIQAATTFRLLNNPGMHVGPQEFSVAERGIDSNIIEDDVALARRVMSNASPTGVTPLTSHLQAIRQRLIMDADELNSRGERLTVVLATDGLPTNEQGIGGYQERNEFTEALRSLQGLPVWIVIRLCTDEDDVVEFYNSIDDQLELSIEVLDDFIGEAQEVHSKNPWLLYSLPLHRMREMGTPHRLFDLLDERRFTKAELREFCFMLFGSGQFDGIEDPDVDFTAFLKGLDGLLKTQQEQWCPIKKKKKPILDLHEMNKLYGDSSSCSIM